MMEMQTAHGETPAVDNMDAKEQNVAAGEKQKVKQDQCGYEGPEYLLLEDSTLEKLPSHVFKILSKLDKNSSQNDYLAAIIYCVALESGFFPYATENEDTRITSFWGYSFSSINVSSQAQLPDEFIYKKDTIYKCNMKLLNFSERNCLLICLRTGDTFCVTLSPEDCPGYSICLSVDRYVLSIIPKNLPAKFRNFKELSFLLKSKIFTPTRNFLMEEEDMFYPGILGIPVENLIYILDKLLIKDIQILSMTCNKLRMICMEYYEKKKLKAKLQKELKKEKQK